MARYSSHRLTVMPVMVVMMIVITSAGYVRNVGNDSMNVWSWLTHFNLQNTGCLLFGCFFIWLLKVQIYLFILSNIALVCVWGNCLNKKLIQTGPSCYHIWEAFSGYASSECFTCRYLAVHFIVHIHYTRVRPMYVQNIHDSFIEIRVSSYGNPISLVLEFLKKRFKRISNK